jgi:trans-aconitate methyltransferase
VNYEAEGCDNSKAMLNIAHANHPGIHFFEWDFHNKLPQSHAKYDVVISKLAVQFINDLSKFATAVSEVLRPSGVLIISVPHPVHTAKQVSNYWEEAEYRQQISKYGIYDTMIHRSAERYAAIFTQSGFAITGISEPAVKLEQLQRHDVRREEFLLPKRLNMRLQKS